MLFFLAFLYVMLVFGPVCGFLLGGLMLSEFVNPSTTPTDLTSDSSAWIGLWWGGFIICGFLYLLSALPFFCFPRRLSTASTCASDSDYGKDIRSKYIFEPPYLVLFRFERDIRQIPVSIVHLLSNGVYIATTLAACMDLGIVSGVTVFLPKYLETQFRLSKSDASIFTGSVAIPGACVGTFIGGWVLKKYRLSVNSIAKYIITVNTVAIILLGIFFFIGCDNPDVAGVVVPYASIMYEGHGQNFRRNRQYNLTDTCNIDCRCSLKEIHLVCGTDRVTYLSPCFAGCRSYKESAGGAMRSSIVGDVTLLNRNYSDCDCIRPYSIGQSDNFEPYATDGPCDSGCRMLIPFLVFLFVLTLAASNSQMPLLMITLRAVKEEEKAFALGIQTLLYRILSYIPAPILYGAMIDTTCLVWDSYCGISGEACLLYDIKSFRHSVAVVAVVQKIIGFLFSLLLYWCIKRRYTPFSAPVTVSEIAHHLVDIESLNVQRCDTVTSLRSWVSDDSLYSRPRSPRHQKTLSY
ncbi:unnamed protein product [Soboliphyme baturini]|uniref:Solute carrier organic anion transporter family member n=1 Tax=Soboliphyme baturini TaxID=241478 RepID=A0A183IMR2_9BILA|nr:unnamed protein product [Soboliphyme baturini]